MQVVLAAVGAPARGRLGHLGRGIRLQAAHLYLALPVLVRPGRGVGHFARAEAAGLSGWASVDRGGAYLPAGHPDAGVTGGSPRPRWSLLGLE